MSRELRRVAPGWEHPLYINEYRGEEHKPLHDRNLARDQAEFDLEQAKWDEGLCRDYSAELKEFPNDILVHDPEKMRWKPIPENAKSRSYSMYSTGVEGGRPKAEDYMPQWSEGEKTHFQLYETVTEGTPVSPIFATKEELARWLETNYAHGFGHRPSYESWMKFLEGPGWSPSAVTVDGVLKDPIEYMIGND